MLAAYRSLARPVGGAGTDVTPISLLHGFGNAAEWTESVVVMNNARVAIVKGRTWAESDPYTQSLQDYSFVAPDARRAAIGFRCARSARNPHD